MRAQTFTPASHEAAAAAALAAIRAKAARKASHNGNVDAKAFWAALAIDGGSDWSRELERAGFTVFQAV